MILGKNDNDKYTLVMCFSVIILEKYQFMQSFKPLNKASYFTVQM